MLDCNWRSILRYIEHVKDNGLVAAVLAVVDRPDHLDDGLTGLDGLFLAVQPNDSELALLLNAIVHNWMVVPSELAAARDYIAPYDKLRLANRIIRQFHAIPALRCAL